MSNKKNKNTDNPPHYNRNINIIRGILFFVVAVAISLYFLKEMYAHFSPVPLKLNTNEYATSEQVLASNIEAQDNLIIAEGLELILKNDCVFCHKYTTSIVGPAFADIAAKYRNDKFALKSLSNKVKLGSSGIWGATPMKSHEDLNSIDIEKMVEYILTLKGGKSQESMPLSENLEIK